MKKIILLISISIMMSSVNSAFALTIDATPSPEITQKQAEITPTPTITSMEKIQDLKNRVATKVAELKLLKKRVFIGNVTSLNEPYVIITSNDGDKKIETNEDTLFSQIINAKSKDIQFKNLKKDQKIITWGTYNQEGDILTAKEIIIKDIPLTLVGTISEVDVKGGTVTLKTQNKSYLLDIEAYSKINIIDKNGKIVRLGFSKVTTDSLALVQAITLIKKDEITYTAYRILVIPPKEESTPTTNPSPTEAKISTTPTKKLSPTGKIDETITP